MSQENVEIVRRSLEIWSSGDIEGLIETMHSEVRFDLSERVFNPGVYEGHDGFRRFLQAIDEVWEDFRIEPLEFIDAGEDKVVVSYLVRGRGKGSGVDAELPSTSVYTLRRGKLIAARMYREHRKALEAAGLRA
jgi:ketosteroid isomerase-like protein